MGIALSICDEVVERVGLARRILLAIDREQRRGDRARIGSDQPASDAHERALAAAVIIHDAGPTLREGDGRARERSVRRAWVGVGDVREFNCMAVLLRTRRPRSV